MTNIQYFNSARELFKDFLAITANREAFLLTDSNVFELVYRPHQKDIFHLPVLTLPAGEQSKNLAETENILNWLMERGADRHSLLICFGGGMITDIGGFAASIYKRGISVCYIPTTLLAMCDAAIGGKNGINLQKSKNQIGTIKFPDHILICPEFLSTLPEKELKSGFAEIIKHFLIADANSFAQLKPSLNATDIDIKLIKKAVDVKSQIVAKDPYEKEFRKVLNFGHTVGHALESLALYELERELPHGFAVAQGMLIESYLSNQICKLPQDEFDQILQTISALYPKFRFTEAQIPAIVSYMKSDKKNKSGTVMAALLERTGKPLPEIELHETDMLDALKWYINLSW